MAGSLEPVLPAAAHGLGICWVGAFDEGRVQRTIHAPARVRPVALLTLGYPAEAPEPPPRRRLDDLVRRERFEWPFAEGASPAAEPP